MTGETRDRDRASRREHDKRGGLSACPASVGEDEVRGDEKWRVVVERLRCAYDDETSLNPFTDLMDLFSIGKAK